VQNHPKFDLKSVDDQFLIPAVPLVGFNLKMKDGHKVREYQKELADPGIKGKNYIIVAPTGSGKTVAAGLVISEHLSGKRGLLHQACHVVFVVDARPLAEQQKKELEGLIPMARVEVYTGDSPGSVVDSIKEGNNISVCTAGKLLDEMRRGLVRFDQLSLIIFDECHHTRKSHPYAQLMEHYLECKKDLECPPQIIGMTASPGAGDNYNLERKKTIDHLLKLAALLDADGGFQTVTMNLAELQENTKSSECTRKILQPRDTSRDLFFTYVAHEMAKLEEFVPKVKNCFERWTQEYETRVQQEKQYLEMQIDENVRDSISTLNLLRCYSDTLRVYMDLRQQDAIKEMESYTGFPDDDTKATQHERALNYGMKSLLENLKQLPVSENPLLLNMKQTLCDTFRSKPTSRAILFIRTKKHAYALHDWVREHRELPMIKPVVVTGHTRETGSGMTKVEQEEVMDGFRNGSTNLLIATSVAEEGLDIPECNLVVRFQHVSNEIAQVQTEGRARAENSQRVTILSSDSRKRFRELKNIELSDLVEEILGEKLFPTGQHLKRHIVKIQDELVNHRRMKAAMKSKERQNHADRTIKLICKTCKGFACYGSDVHKLGAGDTFHYVVPDPAFREKIIFKPHPKPRDLIVEPRVQKIKKLYCAECERDWGVGCIWPADGHTFPVIKCSAFTFQSENSTRTFKKWKEAPFEIKQLSDWLGRNCLDDTHNSSSDNEC
jgi:ERCC4-related helicase